MNTDNRRGRVWTMAAVAALVLVAVPAAAQSPRVEVSVFGGWTFSDGVDGDAILAGDGNFYDELGPKDSASWGLSFGVNATDNVEIGFMFGQQMSELEIKGTAERVVGDITINSYHPYIAFNLTPADAPLRPYILIGFGATNYGSVEFTGAGGVQRETEGETQYSGTFGAGLKIFANNVGARLGVQWTPTYIKTDSAGYWCDPYWGCYVVGDAQYSNQFQLNGGVTFRF